jgi:hypothetical protein
VLINVVGIAVIFISAWEHEVVEHTGVSRARRNGVNANAGSRYFKRGRLGRACCRRNPKNRVTQW